MQATGSFPLTIFATNALGTSSETFNLTVAQPLTIALGNAAFTVGQTALANISTSPAVTGKITLTTKSTLPAGVTFHDNGNGTGKLSGKPAANQNGTYPITITATNGGLATSQTFTLAVAATSPLPTFNVSSVTFTAKVGSTSAVLTSPANARVTEKVLCRPASL